MLTESRSEEKTVAVSAKQIPHSARHIQWEGASVHGEYPIKHTHTHTNGAIESKKRKLS